MAHQEQKDFFHYLIRRFKSFVQQDMNILEVGSQDINGSVREYFPSNSNWLGIDIGPGKGVDLVIPGELIQLPDGWSDISISTECFEHTENWSNILLNMIRITKPDGLVIVTCAGIGRPTHGTIDTNIGSSPYTTNYYKNLGIVELNKAIDFNYYFKSYSFEVDATHGDTFFWGIRNSEINNSDVLDLTDALARARGQLSTQIDQNLQLRREISISKFSIIFWIYKLAKFSKNYFKKIFDEV